MNRERARGQRQRRGARRRQPLVARIDPQGPESHATRAGMIEVITGPMFSGKSEELIRQLRRAEIARLPVQVFKHGVDDRYSVDHVVSHSEWRMPSETVRDAREILERLSPATRVVGVDEAQFFGEAIVGVAEALAGRGVRVILAGLNLDSRGRPFGPMPELLAIAEHVTKLHAICVVCGGEAHFTRRLVPKSAPILVGGRDAYEARCRRCFGRN